MNVNLSFLFVATNLSEKIRLKLGGCVIQRFSALDSFFF